MAETTLSAIRNTCHLIPKGGGGGRLTREAGRHLKTLDEGLAVIIHAFLKSSPARNISRDSRVARGAAQLRQAHTGVRANAIFTGPPAEASLVRVLVAIARTASHSQCALVAGDPRRRSAQAEGLG